MTYTKNEFDNLTREDRELHKFCQTPAWKIAIRMKWIAGRQYRDASDRELPETTPWEENSWVISVWWILPHLGIVNPGDYIIFDWTNRTKLDPTINTDDTISWSWTTEDPLSVVIDQELSEESTNPIENKTITEELNKKMDISIYDPAWWAKQVAFEEDVITEHNDLNNRDSNDSHPISAITDLQSELDSRTAYYYHELDQADSTYYYFWYLQVWWDRRRIRRVNKSDYSVWWAVGDTDYADYWLNRELLDYNPTL